MDELAKKILGIVGYLFAGLLLAFTAANTYALLYDVSQSHLIAAVGLVIFEGGMIYWWSVFRREATGLLQMAISLGMFLVGLVLVTAAVALHLGAVDPTFLGEATPSRIVIIATLLNLAAKLAYPLVHPDVFTEVTERAHEGKIINRTYARFETKIDDIADDLADVMAEQWKDRTRAKVLSTWSGSLNKYQEQPVEAMRPVTVSQAQPVKVSVNGSNGDRPL